MKQSTTHATRREFLRQAASCVMTLPLLTRFSQASAENIRKVHVLFKTHLDIGFTDLAENVIARYVHEFIPTALALARETRERYGEQRFKWTTGSWLMHTYLETAGTAERKKMEQAIEADDICWHALPFTTHSEVLDPSLYEAGLQLSKSLDERFGKITISGKMTDVPGHTLGIVPLLQRNGVLLLHIGVNLASMPPDVPPVFVWQAPDNARILVMYQKEYGGIMPIPHSSEAVAIMFTGDNYGPQTMEEVKAAYGLIQARFPDADVAASDLNAVADTLTPIMDTLPVVSQELGDSWIHGVGSDPLKIAQLRELSRKRNQWIAEGDLEQHSAVDLAFSLPLCMVGEHTWGLDVKTHLQAWEIYTPEALAETRTTEAFQRIEASWQEKRQYIEDAVHALPMPLKVRAQESLEALAPVLPNHSQYAPLAPDNAAVETDALLCVLDPTTGALIRLKNKRTGRDWAAPEHPLALFAYQSFSKQDYDRFMDQYLTACPDWALRDFGKPGMEAFNSCSCTCFTTLKDLWRLDNEEGHILLAELEVTPNTEHSVLGQPRQVFLEYHIHKTKPLIEIALKWFGKQANRLPEALWLSFVPVVGAHGAWSMDKMGQKVNPGDVVKNGGHKLHAVTNTIRYSDDAGVISVDSLDAPLVAPGERTLLNFDNAPLDVGGGMHFCLYNNVWGTNFVMWFDEDMAYRFTLTC